MTEILKEYNAGFGESNFSVIYNEGIVEIKITGRLSQGAALALQRELGKNIGKDVKKIVFYAEGLEYISSEGMRTIMSVKQKISIDAHVYFIGASEAVTNVVEKMSDWIIL